LNINCKEVITLSEAEVDDAEAILVLQKIAYQDEAEIHDDFSIQLLLQTIEGTLDEFKSQLVLKAIKDDKIIGSIRAYDVDKTCYINKLIVDPGFQNRGIGSRLLKEIEGRFNDVLRYELFTGYMSERNIYFYKKYGYKEFSRIKKSDKLTLICFEKYLLNNGGEV